MILLADPHPFIVQETVYPSDAEIGAKSQTLAQLRIGRATDLLRIVIDGRSTISLTRSSFPSPAESFKHKVKAPGSVKDHRR
jgi:hypothetical protein